MNDESLETKLRKSSTEKEAVSEELCEAVYEELRRMAGHLMAQERHQITLQPTILVHDVWQQLHSRLGPDCLTHRVAFFAAASEAMRRLLVDEARRRLRLKRGGGAEVIPIDEAPTIAAETNERLLLVHDAMAELQTADPRKAQIVRLHFFGGLSHQEIALLLEMGESSVRREWTLARALLYRSIKETL